MKFGVSLTFIYYLRQGFKKVASTLHKACVVAIARPKRTQELCKPNELRFALQALVDKTYLYIYSFTYLELLITLPMKTSQ